jgi:GR25 family glycosyltransferase involved in LPS biosynthesis
MSPFDFFGDIRCINLNSATQRWAAMARRFEQLGIDSRVRRFAAVATPGNHHIGCALSHRRILEEAHEQGLKSVLVFEDDALFLDRIGEVLAGAIDELKRLDWQLCYLGAFRWGGRLDPEPGCCYLNRARNVTCTHAIAYSALVYDRILADLPADVAGMEEWLKAEHGIDQYLCRIEQAFVVHPPVSTQPFMLPYEAPVDQFHFTI